MCDKFSGQPKVNQIAKSKFINNRKGFAYIEFAEKESVDASMALEGSMFKGRQIKGQIFKGYIPNIDTGSRKISHFLE